MRCLSTLGHIRTSRHIRTRHSARTNTGPGRARWPRLKETERLAIEEQHLQSRQQGTRYEYRWGRKIPPTVLRR
jgi:hypothetical protein